MRNLTRILVAVAMAGMTAVAFVLEWRRARRVARDASARVRSQRAAAKRSLSDEDAPPPQLSPAMFIASHFGLLVLLIAMVGIGLGLRGIRRYPPRTTWHVHDGDAQRGRAAVVAYGCGGCHVIPSIRGATGRVGPSLDGFAERMYIGGQLSNIPANLVSWLQDPQRHAPGTAMPNLSITEPAARDMAAYLYDK